MHEAVHQHRRARARENHLPISHTPNQSLRFHHRPDRR
jgi:hypothetical protein